MPLSHDQVRHIAKLCRLNLSDAEVEVYGKEMTQILDFITQLQEVDTTNVEPTAQSTQGRNLLRADEVLVSPVDPDALLACSPLPIIEHQIATPSAHG